MTKEETQETNSVGVESQIAQWRSALLKSKAVDSNDADELESHLRDEIDNLVENGLSSQEAFLIAVGRLGAVNSVTAEFARVQGERMWKQLSVVQPESTDRPRFIATVLIAIASAVLIEIARLVAMNYAGIDSNWFFRGLGLLLLPALVVWFLWLRRPGWRIVVFLIVSIALVSAANFFFPWQSAGTGQPNLAGNIGSTEFVFALHMPVLLWFVVGGAFLGKDWRSQSRRMDFLRFSGEWLIYYTLIAIGGWVLMMLTSLVLIPFGVEVIAEVSSWVVPAGAAGAVIIAAWLVEAKQAIIENIAPVLAAIFTPLFAVLLVASSVLYLATRVWQDFDRELLIGFDALLLVVVGLVIYGISARDFSKPVGFADWSRAIAIVAAIVLDTLILVSMFSRVGEFGFTPNRIAALGLNLILFFNLLGSAWFALSHVTGRGTVLKLERWQTGYLPIYLGWLTAVVFVLPVIFNFS